MVYSWNGTFLAVIDALKQSQEFRTEPLIVEGLKRFYQLEKASAEMSQMLNELANSDDWYVVLASLRDRQDYSRDEDTRVADAVKKWNDRLTTDLRAILFDPGHLSRAPRKLIKLAWANRELFDAAKASLTKPESDEADIRKQVAEAMLTRFEHEAQPDLDSIESEFQVLATVARHYLKMRKFAKLDGFVYGWPTIATMAMANFRGLVFVEDALKKKGTRPNDADLESRDAKQLFELCVTNDQIIRFLRLPPSFREIGAAELSRYRPLAPVVIGDTIKPKGSEPALAAGQSQQASSSASKLPEVHTLEIKRKSDTGSGEKKEELNYEISFSDSSDNPPIWEVTFSIKKLWEDMRSVMGVSTDDDLQPILKELFSKGFSFAEERMVRAGNFLQQKILSTEMQKHMRDLLSTNRALRIVVKSAEKEIHYLPWEWLPSQIPATPLLSNSHSIVRDFAAATVSPLVSIDPPVRLMSIIPTPPSGRRFTAEMTINNLRNLSLKEQVNYVPLLHEDASRKRVEAELASFQPHFVHFEGFIDVPTTGDTQNLKILFSNDEELDIEQFAAMLKQANVHLLVIGKNGASRVYENPGAMVVFRFAQEGFPATIAPIRAIEDTPAATFTTDLYQALLSGSLLEGALYTARRNLASKAGDWSAFALFADPSKLDYFQVLREST